MDVFFLRHGLADDPASWRGDDFERPLTDEGSARMEREAKTMRRLKIDVEIVLTSPLVRARQTAQLAANGAGFPSPTVDQRVGLDFNLERLTSIIAEYREKRAIMLVGHEPSMSGTIGRLIGHANVEMKKGGLARVDVPNPDVPAGTLVWLLPPKVLAADWGTR